MTFQGQIESVDSTEVSDWTVADHPASSSVVYVADAAVFDADGGTLRVVTSEESSYELVYTATDPDADTLTLSAPLASPLPADTQLLPVPTEYESMATISSLEEGEIRAEIPHHLKAMLPLGDREDEDGEIVLVEEVTLGRYRVKDVVGSRPELDAAFVTNGDEMRLNDAQKRLGEVLAENEAALESARTNLEAAKVDLVRAFGQIDLKADQAYVDSAKQQAITEAKAFTTTMTDGLAKGIESTSLPGTTVMPKDSVWRQTDDTGKYIAVYVQTESPSGSTWVPRTIRDEVIDSMNLGKLTVAGSATMRQAVIDSLVAQMAEFVKADIGNLTVTGTANLDTAVAKRIAANVGVYVELMADQILAGTIKATIGMGTSGAIVCGDPDGARVEITKDGGVSVYRLDPRGLPALAVKLSATEISLGVMGADGSYLGGFDSGGNVLGQRVSAVSQLTVRGVPIIGLMDGGDKPGWLDNFPRPIVARNEKVGVPGKQIATGVEGRNISVSAMLKKGRLYRVKSAIGIMPGTANSGIRTRIRYATGSAYPTTSSPECGPTMTGATYYTGGIVITYANEGFYQPTVDQRVTFLLTYQGLGGAAPTRYDSSIYIEDVGPATPVVGSADDDAAFRTTYQTTWKATASREYRYEGPMISGNDNGNIDMWYYGTQARESAAWVYLGGAVDSNDGGELGRTMPQVLVGAEIIRAEVYVHNKMWWGENVRSGPVVLNALGAASLPTTKLVEGAIFHRDVEAGQGARIEVPPTWFTSGANRGVTFGDRDGYYINDVGVNEYLKSGVFHGVNDPHPPELRLTYIR